MPKAGDVLFYSGSWTSPIDVAIMTRTGSPVVHVGVNIFPTDADNALISARSQGIVATPRGDYSHVMMVDGEYGVNRIPDGIHWLVEQLGKPYGWADILNQALEMAGKDMVLLDKSFDCSHLVACYLWIAGLELDTWMIEENRVTPGDLFRYAQKQGLLLTAQEDSTRP